MCTWAAPGPRLDLFPNGPSKLSRLEDPIGRVQLQLTLPQPDMITFLMAEGKAKVSVTLSKPTDLRCAARPASMLLA